jgi:hypothetical protein
VTIQFVNNFLTLATTITALAIPGNDTNHLIGALSLLLAQVLLHSCYGFLQYPRLDCTQLLNPESCSGELEPIREQASLILHGKEVHHDPKWQTLVSLPLYSAQCARGLFSQRKSCGRLQAVAVEPLLTNTPCPGMSSTWPFFVAALFWTFVFFITDKSIWKVLAIFAIIANEELYKLVPLPQEPQKVFNRLFGRLYASG